MKAKLKILLYGRFDENHVGFYLLNAAKQLPVEVKTADAGRAYEGGWLHRKLSWHVAGRRPASLRKSGEEVLESAIRFQPDVLLTTGISPLEPRILKALGEKNIRRFIYLTDDPWSPAQYAPWFMPALRKYDAVFTTRKANMGDLENHGCRRVIYLPFGYAPEIHYPDPDSAEENYKCDILFYGGADEDRVPYMRRLLKEGFKLHLYGGYWDRYPDLKPAWKGFATASVLRKAVKGASVTVCMVRRQNRDGTCMRTFECAAMGAVMAVEDTCEHRELFGDRNLVYYFASETGLAAAAKLLAKDRTLRDRLSFLVRQFITRESHTYKDRLKTIVRTAGENLT